MDLKTGSLLVAPAVKNSSCSHPRYSGHNFIAHIGIAETIEAVLILVLTLGVIGANCLVIFVINNRRYAAYIHQQVSGSQVLLPIRLKAKQSYLCFGSHVIFSPPWP